MAHGPVHWLPETCFESPAATGLFAEAVLQWSAHWFGAREWHPADTWQAVGADHAENWTRLRTMPAGTIIGRDRATLLLALGALGLPDQQRFTEADLRLLRRLAARILDDLQERIARLCNASAAASSADGPQFVLPIGPAGDAVIALQFPAGQLAPVVKAAFPAVYTGGRLVAPARACDAQQIEVSAFLGTAQLSIEQIAQFEIGDVIVLDREISSPVTLELSGQTTDLACQIVERDGRIVLEVVD